MSAIRQHLQFVHDSVHVLAKKKQFSGPFMYDAGGDLSKRWYVYYRYRNPETGLLQRMDNIDVGINEHKNKRDRSLALKRLYEAVKEILEKDFNPFEQASLDAAPANKNTTIAEAIDHALQVAKRLYAETSYPDFKSRLTRFKAWITEHGHSTKNITNLTERLIVIYLSHVLQTSSPRNRNNTRTAISGLFKILKDEKIISSNPVDDIIVLSSKPVKNKSFTVDQEEKVLDEILATSPWLYLFIGFVSINLLRPIEICRLHVGDLSINDKVLRFKAKNQPQKTKIIPEMLLRELPDLTRYKRTDLLFTPNGPGEWATGEVNRRNYYSDLFKQVKDKLGLGPEYGLYSFRHTYILKLYKELRKSFAPFEAKSRLMLITGHGSMKALDAYLREIDAELPDDYSHLLEKAKAPDEPGAF